MSDDLSTGRLPHVKGGVYFTVAVVVMVLLAVVWSCSISVARSYARGQRASAKPIAPGDRLATKRLLEADYRLLKAVVAHDRAAQDAAAEAAEALGRECKGVLRGIPNESEINEEEGLAPSTSPRLSGRAQGERARTEQEKQTIDLEIGERMSEAANHVLRHSYETYVAAVDRLTWSDPTIDGLVHQQATRIREDLVRPPVDACADMRVWAASGFHVLPPRSRSLEEDREARNKQTVRGDLRALLQPYKDRAARAILRRIKALSEHLKEKERADEQVSRADHHMELALGEKVSRFAKQQVAPVIDRGRTHAGTTFVIRASVGRDSGDSCRHEVEVELRERNGGSSGGVCLSEGSHSQPSGDCSGSVDTVELATAPDVRRARIRLSDGQTVTVSVVHIPGKDGGPAGVLIDAFRGRRHYPVAVQELSRNGNVLRTVHLGGVSCANGPAAPVPRLVGLATVIAPSGERLTIQGTLVRFQGHTEFSLGPQPGMRNAEAGEEHGHPARQFRWDLSTECASHAYSLLDGILAPPGASVLVRTSAGLAPLMRVELAASMHAAGPLFYGVYATPPTEIVVERSDGSVLYTESIAAKATEETEFCEGYAER